jgi:hypothetical protein
MYSIDIYEYELYLKSIFEWEIYKNGARWSLIKFWRCKNMKFCIIYSQIIVFSKKLIMKILNFCICGPGRAQKNLKS